MRSHEACAFGLRRKCCATLSKCCGQVDIEEAYDDDWTAAALVSECCEMLRV